MNYNQLMLIGLGLFGVLLHCLIELNKINKRTKGKAKISEYFKLEVFSILISVCMSIASSFVGNEIKLALEKIGYEWLLGIAFITIGYMGQSLLVFVMGKAGSAIGKPDENSDAVAEKTDVDNKDQQN